MDQAALAAGLTGKASRQTIVQFGDTATTRATIRMYSFGVKSCAIQQTMHIVDVVYAPAQQLGGVAESGDCGRRP
jgi:UDP-N-acetylglucosamine transferase subunit ALG13